MSYFIKTDRTGFTIAYDAKRFFRNTSGLGNYSRDLVASLSVYYPENRYLLLDTKAEGLGAEITSRENVQPVKIKGFLSRQLSMGKVAQQYDSALFHGLSGELPVRWDTKRKIPAKIVTIHDLIFLRYPEYYSFFDRKIHYHKFLSAARQADHIIAISTQTKADVIQYLKIPEEKISVLYQSCNPLYAKNYTEEMKTQTRKKYGLPQDYILCVGTIEPRKNALSLLRACKNNDIPVVLVGRKTKYSLQLEKFIRENAMTERVFFPQVESTEDLAVLTASATVVVYPSQFEGFGIPVLEALSSRVPVITSNVSSLPEAAGDCALLVCPENPKDLEAKINYLFNNPSARKELLRNLDAHLEKFNPKNISTELYNLYQRFLP